MRAQRICGYPLARPLNLPPPNCGMSVAGSLLGQTEPFSIQ